MATVSAITEDQIDGNMAQAMLSQSPQCVKILDSAGKLRFMSENGQQLMEVTDFGGLCGQDWWALWPEATHETLKGAVASARRGISVNFEAACPTAGGTLKHWRVRVSPVTGGALDGMIIAASEDISDEVAARDVRQALEVDNLALRRFTRFVAHDLRGPIRHHKLLAELIADTAASAPETGEVPVLAEQIENSAGALLDLLAGLEKLHTAEQTDRARHQPIDIAALTARAARMTGAPDLSLDCKCAGATVIADADQMLIVFANLIENAVKYRGTTPRTQMRVTAKPSDCGTWIDIVVSDDGPGFAGDRLEDVFLPLVRQSNSHGIGGAGLGLSMVERVIQAHGGSAARLDHHPDALNGAIILLRLPASDGAAQPIPVA